MRARQLRTYGNWKKTYCSKFICTLSGIMWFVHMHNEFMQFLIILHKTKLYMLSFTLCRWFLIVAWTTVRA